MRRIVMIIATMPLLSCASPVIDVPQSSDSCRNGTTIFSPAIAGRSADDAIFAVFDAVAIPDGGAIVSYDPDTPSPGDEGDVGAKRLVQVNASGSVSDLRLPVLDGVPITVNAVPLVADPNGSVYFYDRDASRVVARDSEDSWRTVIQLDRGLVFRSPHPSIGPGGDLYLATASQILVVREGQASVVAGASVESASDIVFPQALPLGLPSPALDVALPSANAIIVGDDGTIHLATADTLFSISPAGIIDYAGELVGKIPLPMGSGIPNFTGLAIGADGELLVSDSGNQQLISLQGVQATLVAEDVRFIADGTVLNRSGSLPLLTIDADQELVCSL